MTHTQTTDKAKAARRWLVIVVALIAVGGLAIGLQAQQTGDTGKETKEMTEESKTASEERSVEDTAIDDEKLARATFAAGCFWGVEAAFRELEGVKHTAVGYTGGHAKNPSYKEVCTGATGHAEAVRVVYDPELVTYDDLLKIFWKNHDPTQLNRQGPDIGTQYRSAVFFHSEEQKAQAEKTKKIVQESGKFGNRKIVTEIEKAGPFYMAEDYHQQYLEKRGLASCHVSLQ